MTCGGVEDGGRAAVIQHLAGDVGERELVLGLSKDERVQRSPHAGPLVHSGRWQ